MGAFAVLAAEMPSFVELDLCLFQPVGWLVRDWLQPSGSPGNNEVLCIGCRHTVGLRKQWI